jgi:23S rRNA (uracil1939-C5)-methyltransferase
MTKIAIKELGKNGDGIAHIGDRTVYVPFTLPGEMVEVDLKANQNRCQPIKIIEESQQRQPPICQHFTECGGCKLQHLSEAAYREFKTQNLKSTLENNHILLPDKFETIWITPSSRRRTTFKFDGKKVGYSKAKSHEIINITSCPILTTEIEAIMSTLGTITHGKTGEFHIIQTENGLDITLEAKEITLNLTTIQKFTNFSQQHDLARFGIKTKRGYELVYEKNPSITFDNVHIKPQPLGFLQASQQTDHALATIINQTYKTSKPKRIADLFAGQGTLTIPASRHGSVTAFELCDQSLNSMKRIKRISTVKRNLFEKPLTVPELGSFDAIILNPPRAGALDQIKFLAKSNIKQIIYVSCNPASFARDTQHLLDTFKLDQAILLDQFLWSTHSEVIGIFYRRLCK